MKRINQIQEKNFVEGCKKNRPDAQKAVYSTYFPVFVRMAYRYFSDKEKAKDSVQESFIKIFTNINKYNGSGSFEGWMKRIVINDTLNQIKKEKNRLFNTSEISDDDLQISESQDENQENEYSFSEEILTAAIQNLPDSLRIVFNLICLESYSHKEVSELLNISEENSRSRLMKARIKLKTYLLKSTSKVLV